MTLQAISKGFELFKEIGLRFSLNILPLVILFGFVAGQGSSSSLAEGISNRDILLILLNNFLIAPLITIFAILLANDLVEKKDRDVLVYYAISWKFLLKILILSLITASLIGIGLILFIIPGLLFAAIFLLVNYFAILENKSIQDSILLSWKKSRNNFIQYLLMASFFWMLTILSISFFSYVSESFNNLNEIPMYISFLSSSIAIYIQVCLISFPILVFYKSESQTRSKIESS